MKKWLCFILSIVFVLTLSAYAVPSCAQENGGEESGEYDPFSPENQANGVSPEERHQYEEQSALRMRSFASSASDTRYINVLLSQDDASQQGHTLASVCFTGNYALCNDVDEPVFQITSDYEYTVALNGTSVELRSSTGTVLYSNTNGFYFKEYAPPEGQDYNYFKVGKVSNGNPNSDRIYRGELNCYYIVQSGLYNSKYLWTGLYLVNHVYIDDYIKGVIPAEIGTSSPSAALEAQAIVARNYAVRSKRTDGRVFDVYDYNLSQVYFGIFGTAATDKAVEDTASQLLTYNGSAIKAYYCDSNGGFTEISYNEWSGEGNSGPESVREDLADVAGVTGTRYFEEITIPASDPVKMYSDSPMMNVLAYALQSGGNTAATVENVAAASLSMENGPCYDSNGAFVETKCLHHDGTGDVCSHFCSLIITFHGVTVDGAPVGDGEVSVTLKDTDFYISKGLGIFRYSDPSHYWCLAKDTDNDKIIDSYVLRHARHGSGVGL